MKAELEDRVIKDIFSNIVESLNAPADVKPGTSETHAEPIEGSIEVIRKYVRDYVEITSKSRNAKGLSLNIVVNMSHGTDQLKQKVSCSWRSTTKFCDEYGTPFDVGALGDRDGDLPFNGEEPRGDNEEEI